MTFQELLEKWRNALIPENLINLHHAAFPEGATPLEDASKQECADEAQPIYEALVALSERLIHMHPVGNSGQVIRQRCMRCQLDAILGQPATSDKTKGER